MDLTGKTRHLPVFWPFDPFRIEAFIWSFPAANPKAANCWASSFRSCPNGNICSTSVTVSATLVPQAACSGPFYPCPPEGL